jgi:predicted nucleotidyltransferase
MNKIFLKTFNQFIRRSISDVELKQFIEIIALVGSVRTKEAIYSYSDLDILLLIKSNQRGTINFNIINKLKKIVKDLSKLYNVKISLLTHTFNDLEYYVDPEYLIHYSWGRVVYTQGKNLKQEIRKILKNRNYTQKDFQKLIIYNVRHGRFNIIRKFASLNEYNITNYYKSLGKELIDYIFELCEWSLIYNNKWPRTKKKMIEQFSTNYNKVVDISILKQAEFLRNQWLKIDSKALKYFIPSAIKFITKISDFLIEDYIKKQ